ncbi:MAG: mechanosensitive ion channel domain-containing protein [Acidiferrobacterales bacterium]
MQRQITFATVPTTGGTLSRPRLLRWAALAVLVCIALTLSTDLWAQEKSEERQPQDLAREVGQIERALVRAPAGEQTLSGWLKSLTAIKKVASACVPKTEKALQKINEDLYNLGVPGKGEPPEVVRQRKALEKEKTRLENRLATCQVLIQRSSDLLPKIASLQDRLRAQRLFARGPTIVAILGDEQLALGVLVDAAKTFITTRSVLAQASSTELGVLVLVLVVATTLGALLRRQMMGWARRHRWHDSLAGQLGRSLVTVFAHYAPYLLFSIAAAAFFFYFTLGPRTLPVLGVVAFGLPPYFFMATVIHVFLAPFAPGEVFWNVPKDVGRALAISLKAFLLLVFALYLVLATVLTQSLPLPFLLLARAVFAILAFLNLVWVLYLLGRIPALVKTLWLRAIVLLVLLTAIAAELVGYGNLSIWVLRDVVGTLIAFGILKLLLHLFRDLFDGLDAGRYAWHRRVRKALAFKPGGHIAGLAWMRFVVASFLWATFLVALLYIWGLPQAHLNRLYTLAAEGFTVGSLTINPSRIVLAILILSVLLALSGWIRGGLARRWLPRTRMDRGAREATVTMSGYIGDVGYVTYIVIAFIVALSVAGVQFTNLAIIVGALSVGIGFGLQGVVNNFVSGLILLFERPIKTGDWIVVGDIEGYVKSIRIRSTQIQTFDRADVIVPNSDLISNPVTNWMLKEARGRIRVPVGVAYGSDTEKVRDILLEVASGHDMVIKDGSAPEPQVRFRGFGDSSLDFELRCHIDHIDNRMLVISDLNFAIDKAFREHDVEIPFPQRDIHVRTWAAPQKGLPTLRKAPPRKRPQPAARKAKARPPDADD